MRFRNRADELREVKELLESGRFEFLVLYGRRRIGKTELLLQATKKSRRLYYLATTENNLERFHNACTEFDSESAKLKSDYEVLFDFLKGRAEVVVIDEFQNMVKEDKGVLSIFQAIVDTKLKESRMKLFLSGSSISLMTSRVLSYQSPLYGRRTASIKLRPVRFSSLHEFFPQASVEELAEIFGFADGIPYYLIKIEGKFWKWLENEIRHERGFLKDEADFMMRYEFDNPSTYKLILEAIANGKTKMNEIKDFVKAERTDLSPYIRNLIEVEFIKREVPVNENQKSRNGRYYLNDNFLKFWFRFIYPNLSSIEEGAFDIGIIKNAYPEYLGQVFEQIARQFLASNKSFKFSKIGRWWWKDKEIDIVALNEQAKEALFAECKWKKNVNALKIAKELNKKTRFFEWGRRKRREILVIFAKSFSQKIKSFEGKKVHCYDLKDIKAGKLQNSGMK